MHLMTFRGGRGKSLGETTGNDDMQPVTRTNRPEIRRHRQLVLELIGRSLAANPLKTLQWLEGVRDRFVSHSRPLFPAVTEIFRCFQ